MSARVLAVSLASLIAACPGPDAPPAEVHTYLSGAEGFDTASYWIDTGAEVVVFDTQFTPELAQALIDDIRAHTDAPIRYAVVTHPNPDKFNGATVFQQIGAQIVASEATAAALPGVHAYKEAYFVGAGVFEEGSYPELPTIDLTFADSLSLDLDGDVDITLHRLSAAGVSSTQTVAEVPGAWIVGDLVAGQAHAWLEGGIVDGAPTPDVGGWIDALGELESMAAPSDVIYPGRGDAGPVAETIPEQIAYLDTMDALVAGYVAELDDPTAALTGADAGAHYQAITALAEDAFPAYDLSYLVTYGVYGLALQHAAHP